MNIILIKFVSQFLKVRLFIRFLCFMIADEVDVIGYTSNQSDTDDHSSVQSSSDSGVTMSTSRLTLSEMMDNLQVYMIYHLFFIYLEFLNILIACFKISSLRCHSILKISCSKIYCNFIVRKLLIILNIFTILSL